MRQIFVNTRFKIINIINIVFFVIVIVALIQWYLIVIYFYYYYSVSKRHMKINSFYIF